MRLFRFVAVVALVLAAGAASAEEIPNPEFVSWSKFKKGTSVTLKTTATVSGITSETLSTTTLVEVGPGQVVIETKAVSKVNGMSFDSPPQKREVAKTLKLPDGGKKPDAKGGQPPGTYEEGTETLKVGGTEIKTKWYKTRSEGDGFKTDSKVWMSDDAPGVMVKMEAITTGADASTIKMELVEFKKP
ncbi:MAG: hypothetical protein J0I06_04175 [Planctomycetes bacterium]|nr:hypothetical protein [Planctomycetota bacterium]